jgi:hypothetical protein
VHSEPPAPKTDHLVATVVWPLLIVPSVLWK